jgi:predicted GNAT family N-acyltransferase
VVLLGRLAIHEDLEGKGNGRLLLVDALRNCYQLSNSIAATGVIVDAIDEEAKAWYEKFGFVPFPNNPMRLYLPMKTIKKLFDK